jgi:DNA-binding MarR family transcriptional regulator
MKEIEMIELVGNVARKLAKRFGPLAKETGLSVAEAAALWKLRKGPRKASEIADTLGLSPSTVTGIIDRLEAGGWIAREADAADRRAILVRPAPKLSDFVRRAKAAVSRELEGTFESLPDGLMERLCDDLRRVLECLDRNEAERR